MLINICIQWQNVKLHVKNKNLMKIPIWIFWNKLPTQVNQWKNMLQRNCWFWHITKWIPRKFDVLFNGWEDMKLCFLLLIFFTYVRSQIENERIFLTHNYKPKEVYNQIIFLNAIFVRKKWYVDLRSNCKPSSNLVDLIEKDFDFEKELKEFESSFE